MSDDPIKDILEELNLPANTEDSKPITENLRYRKSKPNLSIRPIGVYCIRNAQHNGRMWLQHDDGSWTCSATCFDLYTGKIPETIKKPRKVERPTNAVCAYDKGHDGNYWHIVETDLGPQWACSYWCGIKLQKNLAEVAIDKLVEKLKG